MKVWSINKRKIELITGNIALVDADAIVNAANKSLVLGGGVAGAIRQYGGPSIQEECNALGPIEVGEAVMTRGGNLKADYVIHAAGPVYGEGDEDVKLKNATLNSLEIAAKKELNSLAFPAISTGIFRYPLKRCSEIMLKTTMEFIRSHEYPETIIFCLYEEKALSVFGETLDNLMKSKK
jgi:O-acetyl-ADP-ribose deacetylase (regulator of RNase III)